MCIYLYENMESIFSHIFESPNKFIYTHNNLIQKKNLSIHTNSGLFSGSQSRSQSFPGAGAKK